MRSAAGVRYSQTWLTLEICHFSNAGYVIREGKVTLQQDTQVLHIITSFNDIFAYSYHWLPIAIVMTSLELEEVSFRVIQFQFVLEHPLLDIRDAVLLVTECRSGFIRSRAVKC